MNNFEISSKDGAVCGIYEGENPQDALLSMFRYAGYGSDNVWMDDGGEIAFSHDYESLLGYTENWRIKLVN